jgi:hypothetical protein
MRKLLLLFCFAGSFLVPARKTLRGQGYTCKPSDTYSAMMIKSINSAIADTTTRRVLSLPNVPPAQVTLATDPVLCNKAGLAVDSVAHAQHLGNPMPSHGTGAYYVIRIGTYAGVTHLDSPNTHFAPLFIFGPLWEFLGFAGL